MNEDIQLEENFITPFSEEEEDHYLLLIHAGAITVNTLDIKYHKIVTQLLLSAVQIGMDGYSDVVIAKRKKFKLGSYEDRIYNKLKDNIYQFSAAKQYQQVRTLSRFINTKGEKSTFNQFKKLAKTVFRNYNESYLKTEYITAIGQAQSAREWAEAIERKDEFPLLTYRTQKDGRVRDEHAALDGITLPIDHKFWNTYMPKNGWRCRCFTVSKSKRSKVTDLKTVDLSDLKDEKKFPKVFRMNPGKHGVVFDTKSHPYFKVGKNDLALKKNNFNLPTS